MEGKGVVFSGGTLGIQWRNQGGFGRGLRLLSGESLCWRLA